LTTSCGLFLKCFCHFPFPFILCLGPLFFVPTLPLLLVCQVAITISLCTKKLVTHIPLPIFTLLFISMAPISYLSPLGHHSTLSYLMPLLWLLMSPTTSVPLFNVIQHYSIMFNVTCVHNFSLQSFWVMMIFINMNRMDPFHVLLNITLCIIYVWLKGITCRYVKLEEQNCKMSYKAGFVVECKYVKLWNEVVWSTSYFGGHNKVGW
jgi:hypothetical protein